MCTNKVFYLPIWSCVKILKPGTGFCSVRTFPMLHFILVLKSVLFWLRFKSSEFNIQPRNHRHTVIKALLHAFSARKAHIYTLFASWEIRIVKNCDRSLENAAHVRYVAEVMGSIPIQVWIFSGLIFTVICVLLCDVF